ncbi:helix-turn-helix domain-containing protein [Bradyrhizobium sp. CCGB12]|uniref:helix-turn-helix domain-containing protein n=1 Tax=Bradyrhizobium sp. CCGB12 TaxID=2949632 RepID=UPI0020B31DC8|nr:helix-turn-helix domain-containing protein [Bradyrhizobium sp. CCGB12]MCP3392352.1 helix-turn-helix domain-containing protein [Bradyrhizobium sp. CCGB12]
MIASPYQPFGQLLVELRQKAGISSQGEFATLVKSSQQTVSRWEAGLSRPRDSQMPLIAAVLKADVADLLEAAGFIRKTAVVSFDQPFPVDGLTPDSFERFCRHFLQAMYTEALVEHAGGQGHTQDGLDVTASFPDGTTFSFQCKRVGEFGPQKVHAAVAKHTVAAAKKVLLLTKIASPQARTAIKDHPDWEIWDREDISYKIRQLPVADQVRLVDIFFRGQRFALLGVNEAGPWETSEEFFAAFNNAEGVFNHVWHLVGRKGDLEAMDQALGDPSVAAILLIGTGGSGKSRILKQSIEAFEEGHKSVAVRYLSRNAELTKKSLEDLGNNEKLLVVDDAHDQTDLQILFQYAADPANKARLVLSLRPYGLDHIKAQASTFSLIGPPLREIALERLTLTESEQLATQVLKKHGGPLSAAKDIARLTRDCPLATVVGAQVVAKEKRQFSLAQQEETFRKLLFSRFQTIIAGQIGNKSEAGTIKKVLRVLALLQPVHPEDEALLHVIEQVESIKPHDASRIMRLLTEAGVLFKRGEQFRLSPDVLADYIIEEHCVGPLGSSTGYAEIVFDAASENLAEHLLVNLSRLDWRRSDGDPSNSKLIDGVWSKLKPERDFSDPHIKAIAAVAYYQPAKAIEFAEKLIHADKFLKQLPEILRNAAFNFAHVRQACEALWELGRRDSRPLEQHPEHPIRILAELCEVQPNKPLVYNEAIIDFGLSLLDQREAWQPAYSPLDILTPVFDTEGHITESINFSLTFKPHFVKVEAIKPLRTKVLSRIIDLLFDPDVRVGVLAADALAKAFRYPMGMFNSTVSPRIRDEWTGVFVEGLNAIEAALKARPVDDLVKLSVWKAISWHVQYGKGDASDAARHLQAGLPSSLEFRTLTVLIDGHGVEFRRIDPIKHREKWAAHIAALVRDLETSYPNAEARRAFIGGLLGSISRNYKKSSATPYALYEALIRSSIDFCRVTLNNALAQPDSETVRFLPGALIALWDHSPDEARAATGDLLATGREQFLSSVAQAYSRVLTSGLYSDSDIAVLRRLLSSPSAWVARNAINTLTSLPEEKVSLVIELARVANIGDSHQLADELLTVFTFNELFKHLAVEDVNALLEKLMAVAELEGHWVEEFLAHASQAYPRETMAFFMRRVDRAGEKEQRKYRPINHGPYGRVPLRFRDSGVYPELLRTVAEWMRAGKDKPFLFGYRARELFETCFRPFDGETVKFLEEWIATSDEQDLNLIAGILNGAHHTFVFTHRPFVERYLEKAKQVGPKALKHAIGALFSSAVSGVRSGTPGEPMPRDISMKERSEQVLRSLPRFSPAHKLYDGIRKHAEEGLAESRHVKESFED